jgi:protocatechuate 3,4-dioxygenase beta subunit
MNPRPYLLILLLSLSLAVAQSEIVMVSPDDPGTPLTIVGSVRDADTGEPISGARIVLYHADDGGRYQASDPADESTARLRAELVTDRQGVFGFRTVLPGEYPDQPLGNRHIHLHTVTAEGYEQMGGVVLFEHNVNDTVRSWAASTGFGVVIALQEVGEGYVGELLLTLSR